MYIMHNIALHHNHRKYMKEQLYFKPLLIIILLMLVAGLASAQYKISGTVIDDKGRPVKGANVYLDNTIDGGTADSTGCI